MIIIAFLFGALAGGIIAGLILSYSILAIDDKRKFIEEYERYWEQFHRRY